MNEMMTWVSPKCAVQRFEANDHVAVCDDYENTYYRFSCNAFKTFLDSIADIWVYHYDPQSKEDKEKWASTEKTWMTGENMWTGNASNSTNLTPGWQAFSKCDVTTEYLTESEVSSIQRGWLDANATPVSETFLGAENFKFNVWVWQDGSNNLHASTDMDVKTQTVIGNFSK